MEAGAMTRLNYVGNKALSSLANQLLGTNIRDSQSGMKALTRALIRKTVLRQRGFAINSEILAEATRVAGRVAEVPISYRKRKGQTKLNPLREGLLITASIVTFLRDHDPLLLFGGIGTLLVVVGLVLAWPVVTEYLEFRTFTLIGRALLAALCWLMGVLLIVSGLLLNALNYSLRKIEEKIGRIE
jgi:dolichol-phosphate mannosyltransferase